MGDMAEAWAGGEIMFEGFDLLRRTLCQCFHATIRKVLHISHNLMTCGRPLGKEAVADALHVTTNQETARDFPGSG